MNLESEWRRLDRLAGLAPDVLVDALDAEAAARLTEVGRLELAALAVISRAWWA